MFGTNELKGAILGDGSRLLVSEMFYTIQGEGPFAGCPALFIRLAGCNLRCTFCDTDFESNTKDYLTKNLISEARSILPQDRLPLIVITGGEPMRQNIAPLCRGLIDAFEGTINPLIIQVETAGTLWPKEMDELMDKDEGHMHFVCSPKTPTVHKKIQQYCFDWKYIIRAGETSEVDGLPIYSTQVEDKEQRLFRPNLEDTANRIWLQPCDEYVEPIAVRGIPQDILQRDETRNKMNTELAAANAMIFGYFVSVQVHKLLGLP